MTLTAYELDDLILDYERNELEFIQARATRLAALAGMMLSALKELKERRLTAAQTEYLMGEHQQLLHSANALEDQVAQLQRKLRDYEGDA